MKPMSRLKSLPPLDTQSMSQPIRFRKAISFASGPRDARIRVVSLALRCGTWAASVSAIEQQTGHPAS